MTIRTQLKAGLIAANHSETLRVRSALKAGAIRLAANHNETSRRETEQPAISPRAADVPNRRDAMTRLRRFAIAALATATVTVGSLAPVPTASAMPRSCVISLSLAQTYIATGNVFYAIGSYQQAHYWWGKAAGIIEACGY